MSEEFGRWLRSEAERQLGRPLNTGPQRPLPTRRENLMEWLSVTWWRIRHPLSSERAAVRAWWDRWPPARSWLFYRRVHVVAWLSRRKRER